ncbi:MAG: YolD-like family protein [Clostridia bacterium]|jgi:hypothetical protein|nr:YolD-like family protein [Clostridia bacterium]
MPIPERAKQFMPFAAVQGLREALEKKEKVIVPRIILSEEMAMELNQKIQLLQKGMVITITYFQDGEYIQTTGTVTLFDKVNRVLRIVNMEIPFEDIVEITFSD